MIVADAMHCQVETAEKIIEAEANYLLVLKENHKNGYNDVAEYVQDDELRKTMKTATTKEVNRDRFEVRTAYIANDINWFYRKDEWANLACIGAIYREVTVKGKTTKTWHYYISSKQLTAGELLYYARNEWSVEAMHWLLDVHFREDYCQIRNKNIQQNLNMARKIALNYIKTFKHKTKSKKALSNIMLSCLVNASFILNVIKET